MYHQIVLLDMTLKLYFYIAFSPFQYMGILELPYFLLFFLPTISSDTICSSSCGSQTIRFPFRLNESLSDCGYPGFTLTCNAPKNQTVLTLARYGDFVVRKINYVAQSLLLHDPDKCLPKKLLGKTLFDSPFTAGLSTNYTLFNCPKQLDNSSLPIVECLSNSTRSIIAIRNGTKVGDVVSKTCFNMTNLVVPSGNSTRRSIGDVLELRWSLPQCEDCESSGGICGFDDQKQIVCSSESPSSDTGDTDKPSTGVQVFKIIALSITIPAMTCAIGVGVFLCLLDSQDPHAGTQQAAVNPHPAPTTEGLDQATIDSYTKVVLGESKRVPGPNDDACPICLSEFSPKDTLRCIPECQHCFHTDCIDEWLRINGSCPLCRKLPSPVHES